MNYNLDNNEKFYEAICKANYLECRDMILNQNDLVNKEISKKYPLILACEKNSFKIIELLIKVCIININFIVILLNHSNNLEWSKY